MLFKLCVHGDAKVVADIEDGVTLGLEELDGEVEEDEERTVFEQGESWSGYDSSS